MTCGFTGGDVPNYFFPKGNFPVFVQYYALVTLCKKANKHVSYLSNHSFIKVLFGLETLL